MGRGLWPLGWSRNPIEVGDGGTGTGVPLTFIWTDALPRVSRSLGAVWGGIASPELKIFPGISRFPAPSTTHT